MTCMLHNQCETTHALPSRVFRLPEERVLKPHIKLLMCGITLATALSSTQIERRKSEGVHVFALFVSNLFVETE